MWLNESFSSLSFFPEIYTVYRADAVYGAKLRGGWVLNIFPKKFLASNVDPTGNVSMNVFRWKML
jgi:hypothetical protein